MTRTNRLLVIFNSLLATILVLVLVQFAPSIANANSTTIVACANKKTGALRIAYKACSKKENNVTWGVTGPQGPAGATGAQGTTGATGAQGAAGLDSTGSAVIKDSSGNRISQIVSIDYFNGTFNRLIEGKVWTFSLRTGLVIGGVDDDLLMFKNSNCTGENLMGTFLDSVTVTDFYSDLKIYNPAKLGGAVGFYKMTSSTPVATTGYTHYINMFGVCTTYTPGGGWGAYGFPVTEVTTLPTIPAPLTISAS